MSFYESLRTPSWKGFEFAVESDGKDFGRDVKKHKLINGKTVDYEDTGVKENVFTVEAVIGGQSDFKEQADEFEALLAEEGVGRLILPHTDELTAVVVSARRRHESNKVGVVYFSITFETVDEETIPPAGISSTYELLNAVDKSNASALSDFKNNYADGMPDFINDQILSQVNDFKGVLNANLGVINKSLSVADFDVSEATAFGNQVISMFKTLVSYKDVLNFSVALDKTNAPEKINYSRIVSALDKAVNVETAFVADGSLSGKNSNAADIFTKVITINSAAEASLSATYDSQNQAINTRNNLLSSVAHLRDLAGAQGWYETYLSLGDLMSGITRDIDNKLGRLPVVKTVKTQAVQSSLLLSYRIFGDDRNSVVPHSDDLIKRNGVINPAFIPPSELEVLDA